MPPATPDILARIVSRKREELREAAIPAQTLRQTAETAKYTRRDFAAALRFRKPAIISEIKKASPSKGVLIDRFHPAELAQSYERGGAAALSVLTDRDFFQGSLEDIKTARAACNLPVLRKDFTIDEYQVLEAAAAGADAILLIAAILEESEMRAFRQLAAEFGMASLAEAHNEPELEKSLRSGAEIVGVNNRDLRTFQVSLETSLGLAPKIPDDLIKVSESGILDAAHIQRLMAAGYNAFLIGERLVRSENATLALKELVA